MGRPTTVGMVVGAVGLFLTGCAGPIPESTEDLAKTRGWRLGLEQAVGADVTAVVEIAYDQASARQAWEQHVHDQLPESRSLHDPGVRGDLDEVDFDEEALLVWSSREAITCPERLEDIDISEGVVAYDLQEYGQDEPMSRGRQGRVEVVGATLLTQGVKVELAASPCGDRDLEYVWLGAVDRDHVPDQGELRDHDPFVVWDDVAVGTYPIE